jgi:hypothetical protein
LSHCSSHLQAGCCLHACDAQVGEHESCGPGNLAVSGFTYNPETFMAAKIGVYNISWRDMGVPTLEKIMDIVQVCRAGQGALMLLTGCEPQQLR